MKDENCAYCVEGEKVDAFGIKVMELPASKVYLFREQSHVGRVIVASKRHVSELVDLERRDRLAFMDDVALVAAALHKLFKPDKINYGAYGDTGCHLHFHLVPKYASDPFEWGGTFAMDPKRKYLTEPEYADLAADLAAELYVGTGSDLRKSLYWMREDIQSDGRVDLREATTLLRALGPLEGSGATIDAFLELLREVRRDEVVTPDESQRIIRTLDELLN